MGGGESWRAQRVQPSFTTSSLPSLCLGNDQWSEACSVGQEMGGWAYLDVTSSSVLFYFKALSVACQPGSQGPCETGHWPRSQLSAAFFFQKWQ